MEVSKEVQEKLIEFQRVEQQLQLVLTQKYQIELVLNEGKKALEELEKAAKSADVHKAIGQILLKVNKEEVISELTEKIDTYDIRMKSLSKQEKKLKEELKELQDRLRGVIGE